MQAAPGTIDRLHAADLRRVVAAYRDLLRSHQDVVNRLNVYPVPDGDTGTNMALTLESVVAALDGCEDMDAVCKAISHGSLMGARGNSGVILSQILRGVAGTFKSLDGAAGSDVADALSAAAEAAYAAVMRPIEGTILTVVKACAEGARAATASALVDVLDAARDAGKEALDRTPDLLPVLKQAGVVDAGGAGFLLFLDAALHVVAGRPLPAPPEDSPTANVSVEAAVAIDDAHGDVSDLRYEVMFFLEADDSTIQRFKEVWAGIGDSIVVVGGDGIWNCHIHTDDIGAAIESALDCGRPRTIRVTDLIEQVEEERWVREGAAADEGEADMTPVETAVVAVATGPGLGRLFRSVGVQRMVAGGQSMNPSTQQILEAVEAAPAQHVVVLPNNKNIIPVAEQVAALTEKSVRVVPTKSVSEGLAAAFVYDPEGPIEVNTEAMSEAAEGVVTGELTQAVRDSGSDAGEITAGDYLGLSRAGIQVVAPTLAEAACALLEKLVTDDHEIVTLIEGEGASPATTRHITEWLGEHRPNAAPEIHHGGQPLYPYLFSIE